MNKKIVMVVDELKDTSAIANIKRNDLEGNSKEQTLKIFNTLQEINDVELYVGPYEFEKNLHKHLNDIVFPMYYGPASHNSKVFVPTLCDLNNIKYVGADAYTQAICNDKSLSKLYAQKFGIKSANGIILRCEQDVPIIVDNLKSLHTPLIVKPNYGGGSTGISQNNLVNTHKDAMKLALKLLKYLNIPIVIEEYIDGYEVELIVVGTSNNISFCEEVQLIINQQKYFDHEIWGYETKDIDDTSVNFCSSNYINKNDMAALMLLFKSFPKLEIIRFDGRIKDGDFYLIELSPDCYLGDDCAFYYAFENKGFTHADMFKYLINNTLNPR